MIPLVTVYITTHNRLEKLKLAIMSVQEQTYENIEIIISDDGSSDGTEEYVRNLSKNTPNILYVRNDVPLGANVARNNALKKANGVYITGLDDDDVFKPGRIELFITNWDSKYSFLCDHFVNKFERVEKNHYKNSSKIVFSCSDLLFQNLASNQIFTLTSRLKSIGGFNSKLKRLQDWDCWLRLSHKYGKAKRYNWCSYVMYHDEIARVSNGLKIHDAFKALVAENIIIYEKYRPNFTDKLLLGAKKINVLDFFHVTSWVEFKMTVKIYFSLFK